MIEKSPLSLKALHADPELEAKCLSIFLANRQSCEECNRRNLYWDKAKYRARSKHVDEELFWGALKISRTYIPIQIGEDNFLLSNNGSFSEICFKLDDMRATSRFRKDKAAQYTLETMMEEAIASSLMEGASTTRAIAKEMLLNKHTPRNNSERMIWNNYQAILYIAEHAEEDLDMEKLLYLHRLMTEDTLERKEDEGRIRTDDSIVVQNIMTGDIVHRPVSYLKLEASLRSLLDLFNGQKECTSQFLHPVVIANIIHFYLAYLHPFYDGNGRTARALFYWYLMKKGYRIMQYLSISRIIKDAKSQYEKAFLEVEADDLDLSYFVLQQLQVLEKAMLSFLSYCKELDEREDKACMFQNEGHNHRQALLMTQLEEQPQLRIETASYATKNNITLQTARSDLRELVAHGILTEIPVNKRKYCYIKKP